MIIGGSASIRREYLTNTSLEHYRFTYLPESDSWKMFNLDAEHGIPLCGLSGGISHASVQSLGASVNALVPSVVCEL
jgi:hypothetical protein